MITDQARDGINKIFTKAAISRFAIDPEDICTVEQSSGLAAAGRGPGRQTDDVVVLTISSLSFRLLLMLHLEASDAAQAYFQKKAQGLTVREIFYEMANLCCGTINQELLRYFPDLGMSTPYALNRRSISFLNELKPGMISHYIISANSVPVMMATMCIFEQKTIDFVYDGRMVEEETGALELF